MVSMQQQEEDIMNNPAPERSHIWDLEANLDFAASFDLNQEFKYRMVNLMKTDRIQLKVLNRCDDLYNLVMDRNEQDYDGRMTGYDCATALFDVLGHRWPDDDFSDQKTGTILEWLAFWSLFRHEVMRHFYDQGWRNSAMLESMLNNYRTGCHDT